MICMSALLMLAVSCKKNKNKETDDPGSGFRASVEQQSGDSKTHLEGLSVKWDDKDAILVTSSTCTTPKRFVTNNPQNEGYDLFALDEETLPEDFYTPSYTAYYPAASFSGSQLTLPATQTYVENTFANGANPMAAASGNDKLDFKNVCGVLKLQLYSTTACQVRSISITSNTGEKLHGTGTVTLTGGVPTLGTLSDGGSTLTLDMGSTGELMGTSESQSSAYYFVVPVNTLGTSFTVKVTETNGNVWSKTANATANLIARSQITVLPKQAVTTKTPVSPSTVTVTAGCEGFVYNVGGSVTVPEGTHTCEFGLVYSATNAAPTLDNGTKVVAGTATFSGTKTFSADITGLAPGTTYHVRAYAMIEGVAYSSEGTVKTVTGDNVPQPMTWANGKSPKKFTVASGKQVYFSQGNLQYIGSAATPYWKFADHQFDFLGNNGQGSTSETADRDLFGWGTSGYNNKYPYMTSKTSTDYGNGSSTNISGTNYDWGVNCAISNGGNQAGKWRTLTMDEWVYLINTRKDGSGELLYGEGKVGSCTPGLIILPDDWSCPSDLTDVVRGPSSWSNVYSYSDWAKMEAAGAVFLPAAGYRSGTTVSLVGLDGFYWSTSYAGTNNDAYRLNFISDNVVPGGDSNRYHGFSVRLVSEN